MSNSGFEYSFGLAVNLGPYGRILANQNVTRAERVIFTPFAKFLDSGSVYVQLFSAKSGATHYFYDNGLSPLTRFFNIMTAGGVTAATTGYLSAKHPDAVYGLAPFLLIPSFTFISLMGPGAVRRRIKNPLNPTIAISYPVSKLCYEGLREELSRLCKQPRRGMYSPLFNNCADFAVAFAKDHGFNVPEPRVKTPYNLYKAIKKLDKNPATPN